MFARSKSRTRFSLRRYAPIVVVGARPDARLRLTETDAPVRVSSKKTRDPPGFSRSRVRTRSYKGMLLPAENRDAAFVACLEALHEIEALFDPTGLAVCREFPFHDLDPVAVSGALIDGEAQHERP